MNIMDEMEFVDYVPDVDDGDGELAQYENRTFKSDARIFHKNAWKTNVKRDKSIVTLSTLVKEFNAAFGNDDGRTGIKKEYLAAQQSYINGIEEDESVRVYPKASSQAVPLQKPACSKISIHFPLNLFPYTPVFGQMPLNFGHNMIYPLSPPAHVSSGGG